MNNKRLIERVSKAVDSCCESREDIIEALNDGMVQVSSRFLIPELIQVRNITFSAGLNSRVVPSDYQREFFDCRNIAINKPISIFNSYSQLLAEFKGCGGSPGKIQGVAIQGRKLLAYPVPAEDYTLELHYYGQPDNFTDNSYEEVVLPPQFRKALVHYAAFTIYENIENGLEGPKPNTDYHESQFEKYMDMLSIYYKEGVSHKPIPIVKGEFL